MSNFHVASFICSSVRATLPKFSMTSAVYSFINSVLHSLVSGFTQQATAQLVGDLRYLRFNVLIREDANSLPFTNVDAEAALSPQLF